MLRTARVGFLVLALGAGVGMGLSTGSVASAQSTPPPTLSGSTAQPPKPAPQGIAVLSVGSGARDEAFALARAVYGSRLRPVTLDEVRARVLAGDAPPPNASRELRELAEVRAAVTGDDAAGRRLLAGIAQQVGAQALLVVRAERAAAPAPPPPPPPGDWPSFAPDSGAPPAPAGNAPAPTTVVARLFLADTADFDAARYSPEPGAAGAAAWQGTITSLEARFPVASRTVGPAGATQAPPALRPEEEKSKPFYASGWFWGAVGGAALLGAAFYFASRDTSSDPIHLQMRVPK